MKKKESNTLSAPFNFARCFNAQCLQSGNCLRRFTTEHDTTDYPYITVVNPLCTPADGKNCPYFRTIEKSRMAWGMKQLLRKVPYQDAILLRKQLIGHFGKSGYYRFYREERAITPDEQEYIRQLFRKRNIAQEPVFDRYTQEYTW